MLDTITLQTIAAGVFFALLIGVLAARSSARREQIYGGLLAQAFHYIGAGALAAVIPCVLTAIILGGGFRVAFPVALGFVLVSLAALVIFAIFEMPARKAHMTQEADRGWTAEDARTSGL